MHPTESIALGSDLGIALCAPPGRLVGVDRGLGGQKFRFRILQGHTIDNLVHQRECVDVEHEMYTHAYATWGYGCMAWGVVAGVVSTGVLSWGYC
jgi:hypothetical protein